MYEFDIVLSRHNTPLTPNERGVMVGLYIFGDSKHLRYEYLSKGASMSWQQNKEKDSVTSAVARLKA